MLLRKLLDYQTQSAAGTPQIILQDNSNARAPAQQMPHMQTGAVAAAVGSYPTSSVSIAPQPTTPANAAAATRSNKATSYSDVQAAGYIASQILQAMISHRSPISNSRGQRSAAPDITYPDFTPTPVADVSAAGGGLHASFNQPEPLVQQQHPQAGALSLQQTALLSSQGAALSMPSTTASQKPVPASSSSSYATATLPSSTVVTGSTGPPQSLPATQADAIAPAVSAAGSQAAAPTQLPATAMPSVYYAPAGAAVALPSYPPQMQAAALPSYASNIGYSPTASGPGNNGILVTTSTPVTIYNPINVTTPLQQTTVQQSGPAGGSASNVLLLAAAAKAMLRPRLVVVPVFLPAGR